MYIDSVDVDQIIKYEKAGIIEGTTSNPTLLLRYGVERLHQIKHMNESSHHTVYVQVVGNTIEEFIEDFSRITAVERDKQFGIKIPLNYEGFRFIQHLKTRHPSRKILGTAVYSAEQGILAAEVGVDYIAPYYNRMANNNIPPNTIITQIRRYIDQRHAHTKIMAASFKNAGQVVDALNAGAHTATIGPDILDTMVNKPLAVSAIEAFNTHGRELDALHS